MTTVQGVCTYATNILGQIPNLHNFHGPSHTYISTTTEVKYSIRVDLSPCRNMQNVLGLLFALNFISVGQKQKIDLKAQAIPAIGPAG